jgi:hypothetical protein
MNFLKSYAAFLSALSFCFLLMPGTKGQSYRYNTPGSEEVYVHLDKKIYVAGESIKYRAYVADATKPGQPSCSRILYFTLTGSGFENEQSWRINFDGKPVAGSFTIPENIKAGMYELRAYTNWMRNAPAETYFTQRLLIMNLTEGIETGMRVFKHDIAGMKQAKSPPSQNDLTVTPSKDMYTTHDLIQLEIDPKQLTGASLSVSVSAESPFDSLLMENHISPSESFSRPSPCRYMVEDKGFILKGRIVRDPRVDVSGCSVWLAVADSVSPRILFSPTDSAGEFQFYLNRTYDNKELIIQLADPQRNTDCKLELFSKTAAMEDTSTIPYELFPNETNLLSTVKDIRLIEAIYAEKPEEVASGPDLIKRNHFFAAERIVVPGEYAEMKNFREIASNIIPEVRFILRNDRFYLQVLSPVRNLWRTNTIVLLNGVPFTDMAYISTLGTKDIQRIEIIQSNFLVGDLTLPGLVSIYTHDRKIPENYLKSQSVRFRNPVMDTADEESADEWNVTEMPGDHYPAFRNNLYWDPFVRISNNNKVKITFQSLLLTGRFKVSVEGLTREGHPVSAAASFEITE